ncbi:calcium-binding protein [Herbaspirillum sp. alder98]|uniref:calcium-binding protein n=1 Tax=Herbaspirillum sp. alder98 TaxID=2913096 RepID=UPI001CD85E73|nr:calcium-binding protein [Herbaspirillum sp. alder98]MCA1323187.1 calcium-binding protein [Herbaspirillum sp. alder98]
MSDDEQSMLQHFALEDDSAEGDRGDDPQVDRPQSQTQTVTRQVRLSGPMGGIYVNHHLLMGAQDKPNFLTGSDQDDEIHGGERDDIVLGQSGNDMLFGEGGDDIIEGDEGIDCLRGGDGNDNLDGGDDHDSLQGERGNDVLTGGQGADNLLGGEGHDVLIGGTGNDSLSGEEGDDIYRFEKGDGKDAIWNAGDSSFSSAGVNYNDRIEYGSGITRDQLWFQRSGQTLLVTNIETGDSQRVKLWYEGENNRIDEFCLDDGSRLPEARVEALVTAMASLPMPAIGSHQLAPAYQKILDPVLAQSWQ